MSNTRLDNKILDLVWQDETDGELDEAQLRELRAEIEDDPEASEKLRAWTRTREAYDTLDDPSDTISAKTRADILREARLAAAEIRESKAQSESGFALGPLLAFAAALLIVGGGVWWLTVRDAPDADPDATRDDTVVAHAPTDDPPAESDPDTDRRVASAETHTDDPQNEALAPDPSPEATAPSGKPNVSASGAEPTEDAEAESAEQAVAKLDMPRKNPRPEPTEDAEDRQQKSGSGDATQRPVRIAQKRGAGAAAGASSGSSPSASNVMEPDIESQSGPLGAAITLYENGAYADAAAALTTIVDGGGDQVADALYYRGLAYQKLQRHIDAIDDLRAVVEKHGQSPRVDNARFSLAASLEAVNSFESARTHYELLASGDSALADQARARLDALRDAGVKGGGGYGDDDSAVAREKEAEAKKKKSSRKRRRSKKSMSPPASDEKNSSYDVLVE